MGERERLEALLKQTFEGRDYYRKLASDEEYPDWYRRSCNAIAIGYIQAAGLIADAIEALPLTVTIHEPGSGH